MKRFRTGLLIALVLSLTGCASWRGGPPSCDGASRRPVGSVPDHTNFVPGLAPDASNLGDHHGQS